MDIFKSFKASDGTEIEYVDIGQGPVLFNIHPYGSSSEMQLPLLELLKDDFRCITFSQRGWGNTKLEGDISLYQSAKDARELLDFLEIDSAYFVGLSMGASVMFAYASLYGSEKMEKAFIMDMTPKLVNDDEFKYGLYQGWYKEEHYKNDLEQIKEDIVEFNKYFTEQCFFQHTPDEERTFEFDESYMKKFEPFAKLMQVSMDEFLRGEPAPVETRYAYWKAMGDADFREDLSKFTCPVLLAFAKPGSIYYEKTGEYLNEKIKDSKLVFFDNNTHISFMFENIPQQVNLIKEFYFE